jgi:hypothetical protein
MPRAANSNMFSCFLQWRLAGCRQSVACYASLFTTPYAAISKQQCVQLFADRRAWQR